MEHGLRFVRKYKHEFTTYAKRRWLGQSLLQIFSTEFKAYSQSYYHKAITEGRITVNKKVVNPDSYKLKEGDKIVHTTVREETPVNSELPTLLHEDDKIVVVNKPSSVPVHPCGNFKYNSLQYLMELCLDKKGLKTVHRLDRQTSGIVFFAKNEVESNNFREALISEKMRKVYYARVQGDFSKICDKDSKVRCDLWIYC